MALSSSRLRISSFHDEELGSNPNRATNYHNDTIRRQIYAPLVAAQSIDHQTRCVIVCQSSVVIATLRCP